MSKIEEIARKRDADIAKLDAQIEAAFNRGDDAEAAELAKKRQKVRADAYKAMTETEEYERAMGTLTNLPGDGATGAERRREVNRSATLVNMVHADVRLLVATARKVTARVT